MVSNKRLRLVAHQEDLDFCLFTPSFFQLYFHNATNDDAGHRKKFSHKFHMLIYLLTRGYRILYLFKGKQIISYLIFTKAGNKIIKGSSKQDYYTIFLYTFPRFRGHGYASLLAQFLLNDLNIDYRFFYKTISKTNPASIKVAVRCGFKMESESIKTGPFHRVIPVQNGTQYFFKATNLKRKNTTEL